AALRYRWDEPLAHLTTPVCFGVRPGDSQFAKADYLRTAGIKVEVMPRDPGEAACEELALLCRHAHGIADAPAAPVEAGAAASYVDGGDGRQLLVRERGGGSGLPLVVLPPVPGATAQLSELLTALGADRRVIAIDPPGCGYSDAVADSPSVDAWAATVLRAVDRIGIDKAALYGRHGGSTIAVELATMRPDRFVSVVLDGPTALDDTQRQALAPSCPALAPRWDGTHLVSLWHFVRDQR